MKVLFVTHKFPPHVGGMETHCAELFKGISEKFETVLLKMPADANRPLWLLTLKSRLKKIFKEDNSFTHVYFNDGLTALVAGTVKRYTDAKVIVTIHGLDMVYPLPIYQNTLISTMKNYIDLAITVSNATAEECLSRGIPKKKVMVIPNGVDLSLENIEEDPDFISRLEEKLNISLEDKKILVSVGRSVERKGFSWFLNNVLPRLNKNIIYLMVGPRQENLQVFRFLKWLLPGKYSRFVTLIGVGVDLVKVDKALKLPEIRGRAFHLGKVPFDDLIQLYKHSYSFVMPNVKIPGDAEGFGLVALESILSGSLPVVSGIEGITEAIKDGKNGIHVKAGDADNWVETIESICSNPRLRERMVNDARIYTRKHFSWEKMNSRYIEVFERLEKE